MRRSRLILGCLVAVMLAPGTLVRSELPRAFNWAPITLAPVSMDEARLGPFKAEAAWEIRSLNFWAGGYSALVATAPDRLLAATDMGRYLSIQLGEGTPIAHGAGSIRNRPDVPGPQRKSSQDTESLTFDPASGTIWAGLEFTNTIERYSSALEFEGSAEPGAMREWGYNSGPEAFARLGDGRFLVIEERAAKWRGNRHRALLFAGDPLDDTDPRRISFEAEEGYRPVDLAPVGKGRALVLYRRLAYGFPTLFATAIGLVDVDSIGRDGVLRARRLAKFDGQVPQDNYEGIAITEGAQGRFVWLISDNNFMTYQRSLLLKLRWDEGTTSAEPERQKARE